MDRMAYVAMTGAAQTMRAQTVVSNNLANVSTTGFRAEIVNATDAPIRGDTYPSRVNVISKGYGADFSAGAMMATGRDLDVAVRGEGWIAIEAADGSEAYTRAGDLYVDSLGRLKTGAGHAVIGDNGPIAIPPYQQLTLGGDGTLSIVPIGQAASTLAIVDRIKLVNPGNEALERRSV